MRTYTDILIAMTFTFAAAAAGCDDVETQPFAGGSDDEVAFRCTTEPCLSLNSPYVERWNIANFPMFINHAEAAPEGDAEMRWTNATKVLEGGPTSMSTLHLSDTGELRISVSSTSTPLSIVGTTFTLDITDGNGTTTRSLKFIGETIPPVGNYFSVPRYQIFTDVEPDEDLGEFESFFDEETKSTWWSVCPINDDSTDAILFKKVRNDYTGVAPVLENDDMSFVIACETSALAKGALQLEVMPNSADGIGRKIGVTDYNALTNAFRAYFDGAAWTTPGMQIYLRHLSSDPKFDQITPAHLPPTPIIGHYEFHLESVYDHDKGMNCKGYVPEYPYGVFRNPAYDPPGLAIPGYAALDSCGGATQWAMFGRVAVAVVRHHLPTNGGGAS